MVSRDDAQLEVDSALDHAVQDIMQKASSLLAEGRPVPTADIATSCLDETFFDLKDNILVVLEDLRWTTGRGNEADEVLRHRAEVQVDVALASAEQEAWDILKDLFALCVLVPPAAVIERLEGVFLLLRESVAVVVDAAVTPPSSPSSSSSSSSSSFQGEDGIVLPLQRRLRRSSPS